MAGKRRFLGLESIALGDTALTTEGHYIPSAGSLTSIEHIKPNSAHIAIEMPEKKDLFTEDSSFPDLSVKVGSRNAYIEFATVDMSSGVLVMAFGGTMSGAVFKFPTSEDIVQNSVVAITEAIDGVKYKVTIPNGTLRANADLKMYNNDPEAGEIGFNITMTKAVSDGGTTVPPLKIEAVSS